MIQLIIHEDSEFGVSSRICFGVMLITQTDQPLKIRFSDSGDLKNL